MIKWTENAGISTFTENVQWAQEEPRNITQTFKDVITADLCWTWKWRDAES